MNTTRNHNVAVGFLALAKAIVLVFALPVALDKLWTSLPRPGLGDTFASLGDPLLWAHIVVLCVAELWLVATIALARELLEALRHRGEFETTSWSRRWAGAIAALVFAWSTGASLGSIAGAAQRPTSRPATSAVAPRSGNATAIEVAHRSGRVRANATAHFDWVDGANRALWRSQREAPRYWPELDLRLVRIGPRGLELILGTPTREAPWPFVVTDTSTWMLDPSVSLEQLRQETAGARRLFAALLPIGRDGEAECLLHLSAGHHLGLVGDPDKIRAGMSQLLSELTNAPWANDVALIRGMPTDSPLLAPTSPGGLQPTRPIVVFLERDHLEVANGELAQALRHSAGVVVAGAPGTENLVLRGHSALLEPFGIKMTLR